MDSVLDHYNKAYITVKWVIWIFSFPNTYKSSLYNVVYQVCNNIMSKKNNDHTLVKKYFIAKKC